jgi:hypothetical protein
MSFCRSPGRQVSRQVQRRQDDGERHQRRERRLRVVSAVLSEILEQTFQWIGAAGLQQRPSGALSHRFPTLLKSCWLVRGANIWLSEIDIDLPRGTPGIDKKAPCPPPPLSFAVQHGYLVQMTNTKPSNMHWLVIFRLAQWCWLHVQDACI